MKAKDFLKLQIQMYVTDSKKPKDYLVCSDFYVILEFGAGKMKLQPLFNDGHISAEKSAFWVHFKDIELTHALHASEFRKITIG